MKKSLVIVSVLLTFLLSILIVPSAFAATNEFFNQSTVSWKSVPGAVCYNIYYGRTNKTKQVWNHAVRCVSNSVLKYTIGYLKQDASYSYTVAALGNSKKEFSWTPVAPMWISPMPR